MNETLKKIEAALTEANKHAAAVQDDLAHCPSALALQARIGNALEMLGSLVRESQTLTAPETKG